MDEFFLKILQSVWPVLVPTLTIIIAVLQLRRRGKQDYEARKRDLDTKHKQNIESTDARYIGLRNEIALLKLELNDTIKEVINGKLERIETKIDSLGNRVEQKIEDLSDRVRETEITIAALKAQQSR
jgi:gas vesicle protein